MRNKEKNTLLYLYSVFRQVYLEGEQFPGVQVRVVCVLEGLFQLLQLVAREDRPAKVRGSSSESANKG